jgi:hypothetical protein
MMVAVDSLWACRIETAELVELSLYDVFEGANQPRMKNDSSKRMSPQARGNFPLAFRETRGAIRRGERCRKVEVKTGVDSRLSRNPRSSFRVLHKNHGTDRGHPLTQRASRYIVSSSMVAAPIVGVHDQKSGASYRRGRRNRLGIRVQRDPFQNRTVLSRGGTASRESAGETLLGSCPLELCGQLQPPSDLFNLRNVRSRCICSRLRNAIISREIGLFFRSIIDQKYPAPKTSPPTIYGFLVP